jgi:tRNA(Arg) A34 adenosine deaminase TadA
MSTKYRFVSAALKASLASNFTKQPMGCVVYRGNKIVVSGYNSRFGSGKATLHAEQHAIEQLARRHRLLPNLRKLLKTYDTPIVEPCTVSPCSLPLYEIQAYRKDRKL